MSNVSGLFSWNYACIFIYFRYFVLVVLVKDQMKCGSEIVESIEEAQVSP